MKIQTKIFKTKEAANERAFNVAVSYPEHSVSRTGRKVVVIENANRLGNLMNFRKSN